MQTLENKFREEIKELQRILSETKERGKDTEDSLRREVESLKSIIQDLENRLGMFGALELLNQTWYA